MLRRLGAFPEDLRRDVLPREGEVASQEQAGAASAWRHQGERPQARREEQGDTEDLAPYHRQEVGCIAQHLHPGLVGLGDPSTLS